MTWVDGTYADAGRGSLAGAVRVLPLLADDAAGVVDGFVGVCSRLLAVAATAGLDGGVDWWRVTLTFLC